MECSRWGWRNEDKNEWMITEITIKTKSDYFMTRMSPENTMAPLAQKGISVRQIPREHSHVSLATWQWSCINVPRLSTHEVWSLHEAPVVLTKRILEVLSSGNPLIAWYYSTNNTSNQFLSHPGLNFFKPFLTSYLSHCTPVVHFN